MSRRRTLVPAIALLVVTTGAGAHPGRAQSPDEVWRDVLIESGPAAAEEPPHPEAAHEWWYFTVQNPAGGACGPWQAMVSAVADREAIHDQLLFTAVVDGTGYDFSAEFPPGSLRRSQTDSVPPATDVRIGDSHLAGAHPAWSLDAVTPEATLHLTLDAGASTLWRRRAPEGWGLLEITAAARTAAAGWLTIAQTGQTCAVSGTGYYEHVWGTWSRVPMWGVDFLNAHLSNGWAVTVRNTPMRGEANLYPRLGADARDYYPAVLILTDGTQVREAVDVAVEIEESLEVHPDLGIRLPARITATGTFAAVGLFLGTVTLTVTNPSLATILFETTSSGVLEGWGGATLARSGDPTPIPGTAEVELQRFGTSYPH